MKTFLYHTLLHNNFRAGRAMEFHECDNAYNITLHKVDLTLMDEEILSGNSMKIRLRILLLHFVDRPGWRIH